MAHLVVDDESHREEAAGTIDAPEAETLVDLEGPVGVGLRP